MKKVLSIIISVIVVVSLMSGCGTKLYYDYDVLDYIKVGSYSNVVDKTSSTFLESCDSFKSDNIGTALDKKIAEGVVQKDDLANIDYVGYLNGEPFDNGADKGYDLKIGSGTFIPGFEEGLIGATIGEEARLNLTFPESYGAEELAGKDVVFLVTVNYVTRAQALNDENVKEFGFSSLSDYEKKRDEFATKVCMYNNIYKAITVEKYPDKESKVLYKDTLKQYETVCENNNITLENFASSNGLTIDEFYDYISDYEVNGAIQFYFTAYYILQDNDVKLTQAEIEEKRAELEEQYDGKLKDYGVSEIIIQQFAAYDKALDLLLPLAEVK